MIEPECAFKPYMIEPVVHQNSDWPNSNRSSFDSSQDKGEFNHFTQGWGQGRVWEGDKRFFSDIFCIYSTLKTIF